MQICKWQGCDELKQHGWDYCGVHRVMHMKGLSEPAVVEQDNLTASQQVRIAALNAAVASLGSNCTRRRIVLRAQEFEDYLNGEVLDRFEGQDSGDD